MGQGWLLIHDQGEKIRQVILCMLRQPFTHLTNFELLEALTTFKELLEQVSSEARIL